MEVILSDLTKFKLDDCHKDRSPILLDRLKKIMLTVKNQQVIDDYQYNFLVPKGAQPPRLYGLPKIHKQDVPLRPILSMVGTFCHKTAKWLTTLLGPIKEGICHHCCTDTFDFINSVKPFSQNIDENTRLASLDAVSPFTSVPVKKCIEIIIDYINALNVEMRLNNPESAAQYMRL